MTQQCIPMNKCQLRSKKAALPISYSSALYPDLNQINLICSLIHLQTLITLTDFHTKESFYLFSQEFSGFQRTISETRILFSLTSPLYR